GWGHQHMYSWALVKSCELMSKYSVAMFGMQTDEHIPDPAASAQETKKYLVRQDEGVRNYVEGHSVDESERLGDLCIATALSEILPFFHDDSSRYELRWQMSMAAIRSYMLYNRTWNKLKDNNPNISPGTDKKIDELVSKDLLTLYVDMILWLFRRTKDPV